MKRRKYYDVLGKISDVGANVNKLGEEIGVTFALSVPFVVTQAAASIVDRLVGILALGLSGVFYRGRPRPRTGNVIYLVRREQ